MSKTREAAVAQTSCGGPQQSEEGRPSEVYSNTPPSSAAAEVKNQTPGLEEGNSAGEMLDEKKARLQRELEELRKEEEKLMKEEEVKDLEHQVEVIRKRLRERQEAKNQEESAPKKTRVASHSSSIALQHSGTMLENPALPVAQTPSTGSLAQSYPLSPRDIVVSAGPSRSSHGRMTTGSLGNLDGLKYYKVLDADESGGSQSFSDMDLDQLRCLAENEAGTKCDIKQKNSAYGHVYYFIFLKTGTMEDLERAVRRAKELVPVNADGPDYAARLKDLIVMQIKKYQLTHSMDDLQEAILLAQGMVAATPSDHPDRSARLTDWIDMMFTKFNRTGSQDDLDEAIIAAQEAGAMVSVDNSDGERTIRLKIQIPTTSQMLLHDPRRAVRFGEIIATTATHHMAEMEPFNIDSEMASCLQDMGDEDLRSFAELHGVPANDGQIELYIYACFLTFTRTRSAHHLEQAIERAKVWVAKTPTDHQDRTRRSQILDMVLGRMHQQNLTLDDISAVLVKRQVTGQEPTFDEIGMQISQLNDQATILAENYQRTGSVVHLNEAIRIMEQVVDMAGGYIQPAILGNLGAIFGMRFERTGSVDDLDRAIDVASKAADATPQDDPGRADILYNLGKILRMLFQQTGSMDDINRAVHVAQKAVDATPQNYPNRARILNGLGILLDIRFERTGSIYDLNSAVDVASKAVDATPQDHPDRADWLNNLNIWLGKQFEQTGSMDYLNRAVDVASKAVDATPEDHPDRAGRLSNLGSYLDRRFERTGSIDDLNRAIDVTSIAVDATPQNYTNRASRLTNLGSRLGKRFERTGSIDDLNRAVDIASIAVDIIPRDHSDRAATLNNFGVILGTKFERIGLIDDLNRAIDVASMAVDAIPQDHPDRAGYLENLGRWLNGRFERAGSIDDLNRAIDVTSIAVDIAPQDHPNRATLLKNLGDWLDIRFKRTGSMDDLNYSIDVASIAVDATPQDHPGRAGWLISLGNRLGTRFERTGSVDDLNRAVDITSMAVDATPQDHPGRAGWLISLGRWLGRRFERTSSMDDLNRAVHVANMGVDATPQDHPDRAAILVSLGAILDMQFERTSLIDDINRAIDITSMAIDIIPQDHPDRASYLGNLGSYLDRRFERTGSMDDLNRAINTANIAVEIISQDHPDRADLLSSLGSHLSKRFKRIGLMDDLNCAIDIASKAVNTTPQNHPDRASRLSRLGCHLGSRFEQTGSIDDLNRAIDIISIAVDATPQDHPDRAGYLNNLGTWLGRRFERTGSMDDINRAINVIKKAVDAAPQDHPNQADILCNLGSILCMQFTRTGSMDDLKYAIDVAIEAVDTTPEDHPNRAGRLSNLGGHLSRLFERTGSIDDLNRAIDVTSIAVDATPQDHPNRAGRLSNLGGDLSRRSEQTGSMDDLNRALSLYREGWHCYTAPPSIRIRLARQAARILASRQDWEGSSQLLQEAVELLPTVSPRSLKHTDKQHMLADFAGLASAAAATALNAGKDAHDALRFLELGRGIIASLLIETRGDISNLKQKHPSLADEFISLRDEIDLPGNDSSLSSSIDEVSSWESLLRRRREAVQELDELRSRIRAQPGFENFHLPPSIDELKAAAHPDPIIIINLSPYRSDAFVIECHQVRVLGLPNLTLEGVHQHAEDLRISRQLATLPISLLEWLWDVVARPVLDALGFQEPVSDTNWPRVWWIPTGLLSQLPLHAAGYHTKGCSETVLDRVMSSYASTVKALIYRRQLHFREPIKPVSYHALLVAMRETPNLPANGSLPFTIDEVEMVKDLCPSLQLRPVTPFLRKEYVLQELQACRIFHFAGHGYSDPAEPSQSCLLLEDWKTNPLTVGDLRDHRLQENPPFLGFLSACSTGANKAAKLADEGINLINAFQLAGFRHVVGTLWEVSDMHCVDVARVLYETLRDEGMTDVAVCRGLHRAVRALRDGGIAADGARDGTLISGTTEAQGATNPYWIPYVHFGV